MGQSPVTRSLASDLEAALTDVWARLQRHTDPPLSRTAASVLAMLAERPRRVTELADAQAVAQPTMTVALQRLEGQGLLRRERDAHDRRVTNVHLTDAGRETLERRRASRGHALARRLDALTAHQRDDLAAALPALQALLHDDPDLPTR